MTKEQQVEIVKLLETDNELTRAILKLIRNELRFYVKNHAEICLQAVHDTNFIGVTPGIREVNTGNANDPLRVSGGLDEKFRVVFPSIPDVTP
jgi:hypothetical protein